MTSTSGEFYSRSGRIKRAAVFVGHYTELVTEPMFFTLAAISLAQWWGLTLPGVLSTALRSALIFSVIGVLCQLLAHNVMLCPRDIKTVDVVLDPQSAVDANRTKLSFHHRRSLMMGIAVLSCTPLIGFLDPAGAERLPVAAGLAVTALIVTGVGAFVLLGRIVNAHRRLRLWCPWCRHGGEDQSASTPRPTPTAAA